MKAATRIVCISQARMTSTRLPGKVMAPIAGEPMLALHLRRLRRSRRLDAVVVATPDSPESQPIVDLCHALDAPLVRGDEADVLSRYAKAARTFNADVVVRVTSDCPLIDPVLVDRTIAAFLTGEADYVALDTTNSYPRGLDCEVMTAAALFEADEKAVAQPEREHVTPYVKTRPERFRCHYLGGGPGPGYRLCVDEPADLDLVRRVAGALVDTPEFGWPEIERVLTENPDWVAINTMVHQKPV